jgi:O-antigen ligase
VGLWVFSGGLVLIEPSPYEVIFLAVIALAIAANMHFYRSTAGLLAIALGFLPFALIAVFQVRYTPTMDAMIYSIVTVFLMLTSFVIANFVAEATEERMRLVMKAYTVSAVLCAIAGTLGYLQLIPGSDILTLYGRAKGTFQDPNVFGPFLVLPAMFALQKVLMGNRREQIIGGLVYVILFTGVFLSFSRGAWGHLAASSLIVLALCFGLEANTRLRLRIMATMLAGALLLIVALAGLLSIPAVSELLEVRLQVQNYDTGETGRFGRQFYAFDLALQNPWGIGPLEFRNLRIIEEPHNVYVNVLLGYGWGGGAVYYVLVAVTLYLGGRGLLRPSPYRRFMIPLIATFSILVLESAIIDTDHWRHWFLLAGLIWGISAAMGIEQRQRAPGRGS